MEECAEGWSEAVSRLRKVYGSDSSAREELEWSVRPDDEIVGEGSGYVVDCLRSARWAVRAGNYEQVVKAAISLGRDTDTTACVAGGIAGIRDGAATIPERWVANLRGKNLFELELEMLVARRLA